MKIPAAIVAITTLLIVAGILMSRSFAPPDPALIAQKGIHWHPTLEIYVRGEKLPIPANIGLGPQYARLPSYGDGGMAMTPMHTHEDMPVIHLEFSGAVKEDDIRLGNFFRIWGKDMRTLGSNMKMMVNGKENTEYENFVMHDGDRIELHYD